MNPGEVFFIRLFALLGICAAPLDIVVILTVGALRPKYNGITSFASLLGVPGTPYAMLISGWWFLYGFMLVFFAVGLLCSMPRDSRVRWIGPLLIAIFGIFDGIGSAAVSRHGKARRIGTLLHGQKGGRKYRVAPDTYRDGHRRGPPVV
jgi:hypothetical protein